MLRILKLRSGQSIIEMLVATSAIVIAILGVLGLLQKSLGFNRVSADNYTATYLAAEGIELTKNLFDREYLIQKNSAAPTSFYGWVPGGVGNGTGIGTGVYEISFEDSSFKKLSSCILTSSGPNQSDVYNLLFNCTEARFLTYSDVSKYSYDSLGSPSKFKRLVIIDNPYPTFTTYGLEYRVTSAVGWQSKGGNFAVQLQDSFLPWRIP